MMKKDLKYRIEQLRLQQGIRNSITDDEALALLILRAEHGPMAKKKRNKRRARAKERNKRLRAQKFNQARRLARLERRVVREERMQKQRMVEVDRRQLQRATSGEPLLHLAIEAYGGL